MRVRHSRHRLRISARVYLGRGPSVMDVQVPYLPSWTGLGGLSFAIEFS